MYHYGDMSLSIVRTDVWQSSDTPVIIFYEASDLSDIFWQTRRRRRWTVSGFSATPGVDFAWLIGRAKNRSQIIRASRIRRQFHRGGSENIWNEQPVRVLPRFAFWSVPPGVSISEGTRHRSMGRFRRRQSFRSRNRSSSRRRLSSDHRKRCLTLYCPFFTPVRLISTSSMAWFGWTSFGRASAAREPLPLECQTSRSATRRSSKVRKLILKRIFQLK